MYITKKDALLIQKINCKSWCYEGYIRHEEMKEISKEPLELCDYYQSHLKNSGISIKSNEELI